ncbi:M48 family metalloprotease [Nonomuraea bangladeshensis]|uniref:M48 family metalloprotease n=1 Tax=Nonomuraea bangladeshensis TaxID=404385 RepID=UPI003C304E16
MPPPEMSPSAPIGQRLPLLERLLTGRPTGFPNLLIWLEFGILRNLRGALTALIAAWLYIPVALTAAVTLGLYGAMLATVFSAASTDGTIFASLHIPLLSDAFATLSAKTGGVGAAMTGAALGMAIGFLLGLDWVFLSPFDNGLIDGFAVLLVTIALGVVVGLLYTLYRVVFERKLLHITGARRMSRREAALILPLVEEAAARLGLPNHPPVLVDDSNEPVAHAYTRHIVITRGFLEHFAYDRETISAILAHELVHWRNGDPISAGFVRGVALPLYVVQAAAGSLLNQTRNSLLRFLLWTIFWPVFVTVRYLVVPMQASDSREAEYRADQGAVLAGYRAGMRHILSDLRRSFEGGRNGWAAAICASHPPPELRLERLEEPGRDYSLPEDGS